MKTRDDWRKIIANYWGLCSLVDTHLGRILDTLRATGQWDNTLIIFTSDHGDMMGSHQLLAKTIMYEEAIRVPWLMKLPGQREQKRVTGPVSQIDLLPTMLDVLGEPAPDDLPGRSLVPEMDSPQRKVQRDVFVIQQGPNWGGPSADLPENDARTREEIIDAVQAAVRTIITPEGWKLCCSARGEHELYHLTADPYEKRNLANNPAQKNRVLELTRRILAWQRETGDPFDITPGVDESLLPKA